MSSFVFIRTFSSVVNLDQPGKGPPTDSLVRTKNFRFERKDTSKGNVPPMFRPFGPWKGAVGKKLTSVADWQQMYFSIIIQDLRKFNFSTV